MRKLLAATCLTPLTFALGAANANAETVISTAITTPVLTSTGNDDVRISSTGSVKPTSGPAVTIDSNDSVKNEGTIQVTGANNATGILANTNLTGNITNTNAIVIDENYTPTDSDSDGDLDGPFAQGTNRFGIHVLGGGTFTGNIANSGNITVEGNQSAGIAIDSILAGNLSSTNGTIEVIGDNGVGVRASTVNGNVNLTSGTIAVRGAGSVGVQLAGNVSGAVVFQNSVIATGYRNTTAPADVSKLDADDLLQGGPAIVISGNVGGGILFDAPPKDNSTTDTDEDDDGIADNLEQTATVTSFGAAPAVQVGSASQSVAIGAVASSSAGHGIVSKGNIAGVGVYKGVSATALSIGGLGQTVNVANGMTLGGVVLARAVEANATAVKIGTGASVPEIVVSGSVIAEGAGAASTAAQAILIDTGATVSTIRNLGVIRATRSGSTGTAAAIIDKSGTLTLVENSGAIGVSDSAALGTSAVALDLSANITGATIRQLALASGTGPSINGQIKFGSGNDLLDIADGTVLGNVSFGGGTNALALSGDALFTGDADFGGGSGTLQLAGTSRLSGQLVGSAGIAATVSTGATLNATNLGNVALGSLTTGSGATLGVTIDSTSNTHTLYSVSGTANIGANNLIEVNLASVGGVAGTYKIIQAGTLTGGAGMTSAVGSLPFLYDSSIIATVPNEISLQIRLKDADELGINRSEESILNAVLGAADSDQGVAGVLLGIDDSQTLQDTLQQMLPEHAGGTFESATKGSRLMAKVLLDPRAPKAENGGLRFWAEQVAWGSSKSIGATSGYSLGGWGAALGGDVQLGGAGAVGLSLAYLSGRDPHGRNSLTSNQYEAGLYWRGQWGGFTGFARATAGLLDFENTRRFSGTIDGNLIERETDGEWKGNVYSASAGIAYDARFGRFSLRPSAIIEHYKLTEKSYDEKGGGTAFDLQVEKRSSDETAASASLAAGYDIWSGENDRPWMRVELEGGRRQILSGSLGKTRARFEGGETFTLTPEQRTSGWLAGLRLMGGGGGMSITGEVNAEEQQDKAAIGGRLSLQFSM
jgi:uncharacterized protein with beta-barrel porin domain